MHKPCHGATSTWNARPQHHQPVAPKPHHSATPTQNTRPHHHQPPMTSTWYIEPHHAAMPTHHTGPCHHAIPNMVHKMEQWWDSGGGGQWDGDGDGSNCEALLLPQTVHILSVQ